MVKALLKEEMLFKQLCNSAFKRIKDIKSISIIAEHDKGKITGTRITRITIKKFPKNLEEKGI